MLLVTPCLFAQAGVTRGQKLILRPSTMALKWDASVDKTMLYTGAVAVTDSGVTINGNAGWAGKAVPDFREMTVKRAGPGKSGYEVELADRFQTVIFSFADEAAAARAMPQLTIASGDTAAIAAWKETVKAAMAQNVFSGSLARIPAPAQSALMALEASHLGHIAGGESFKERDYLVLNTGESEHAYNTIQMNRLQRAGAVAPELLTALKAVHHALGGCDAIYGVKVQTTIPYRNFVTNGDEGRDTIAIYAPCASIAKYSAADISAQALLADSIVMLNGDRVDVTLAQ